MRLLQGSCFCVKSYIVLIALGLGLCAEALQERCYNGQILLKDSNGYYVCVPCPNNTFMSEHEHNHTECYSCSTVKHPELEVEISKCNTTHDAEIGCKHGYYRNKSSSTCIECSVCDNGLFERQECRAYSDTVCCGEKAHIVVVVSGKQLCKMPHCGAGLYLNRTAEKCIECPNNKYMPSTNHTQEECLPCITDVDPESHQVITHHCNRTHQALVECDDGFYGKGQHVNGKPDCYYCTPATVNSACCSYRNMPFVPGLPECQSVTSEPPPGKISQVITVSFIHSLLTSYHDHISFLFVLVFTTFLLSCVNDFLHKPVLTLHSCVRVFLEKASDVKKVLFKTKNFCQCMFTWCCSG